MFAGMRCVEIFSFIFVILIVCCYAETDVDESEADEHAYYWNDDNDEDVVIRQKKNFHAFAGVSRSSARHSNEVLRPKRRFRGRFRGGGGFGRFPSAASFRRPAMRPAVAHHPQVKNPAINKPSVDQLSYNGNGMSQTQNHLQGSNYRGQSSHANANNNPQANPALNGGNGGAQQPNNAGLNKPGMGGMMPIPIPIPIPIGGNHFGRQQHHAHNNTHNNTGKGNGDTNRHVCKDTTKRLLFTIILITIVMMYYLQ